MSGLPARLDPYRIWLRRISEPIAEALDQAILEAVTEVESLNRKLASQLGFGTELTWNVDQDTGLLKLDFEKGTPLQARIQIIGTWDGDSFLWAWANQSINADLARDSKALSEWGKGQGWGLFRSEKFPAIARDGSVLAALAASILDASGTYTQESGQTVIYFTVREPMRKRGLKLRKFDSRSDGLLTDLITPLLGPYPSLELSLEDHLDVKLLADRGLEAANSGRYHDAIEVYSLAWAKLAPHHSDMEPAGWIQGAWAMAELGSDRVDDALSRAWDTLITRSNAVCYAIVAECRKRKGDLEGAKRALLSAYVMGSESIVFDRTLLDEALTQLWTSLDSRVEARLLTATQAHDTRRESAIVRCLVEDWHEIELERHALATKAEKTRKVKHEIEHEELSEMLIHDEEWAALLATYFVPGRHPRMGSWSSPPQHNPATEDIVNVEQLMDHFNVYTKRFEDGEEDLWRYSLRKVGGRLLVDQVYSVWPDEEIPMIS